MACGQQWSERQRPFWPFRSTCHPFQTICWSFLTDFSTKIGEKKEPGSAIFWSDFSQNKLTKKYSDTFLRFGRSTQKNFQRMIDDGCLPFIIFMNSFSRMFSFRIRWVRSSLPCSFSGFSKKPIKRGRLNLFVRASWPLFGPFCAKKPQCRILNDRLFWKAWTHVRDRQKSFALPDKTHSTSSSYPGGNFGGNQLLDGSISLSPLYSCHTNDLHVSIDSSLHQGFPWLYPAQA